MTLRRLGEKKGQMQRPREGRGSTGMSGNYTYVTRVSTGQEEREDAARPRRGWERATGPS